MLLRHLLLLLLLLLLTISTAAAQTITDGDTIKLNGTRWRRRARVA